MPILVQTFTNAGDLQTRLNNLATDPDNKYELKFLTHDPTNYTIVLAWEPN